MEVFADGRDPKPVMTLLTMVGRSISTPGTWAAMSSSPTLLRLPDFSSVMPRPPLAPVLARTSLRSSLAHIFGWSCRGPSPFRLSQTLVIAITACCTRLHRHLDVVDDDQPLEGRLSDVAGVRQPVQPGQQ